MRNVFSGDSALPNRPGHNGSPHQGEFSPAASVNSDSSNLFELFFAASCQLNVPELSSYEEQWRRAATLFAPRKIKTAPRRIRSRRWRRIPEAAAIYRLPPVVRMMPVSPLKRADAKNSL